MDAKKKKDVKPASKKEEEIQQEIEKEREHPEEIIKEELAKKDTYKEPHNPELEKSSLKLMLYAVFGAVAVIGIILFVSNFVEIEETFYEYNGFTFEKYPGSEGWYTSIRLNNMIYPLPFYHGPKELEDIPYDIDEDLLLSSEFIFLSIPPMDSESGEDARRMGIAAIEVGKILGTRNNIFNIPAKASLTHAPEEQNASIDETPIVNCNNVPENSSAIVFQLGGFNGVFQENENCFVVQGTNARNVIKSSNRLVYGLLGIMI